MPGGPLGVWYNPGHLSPYARMLRCVSALVGHLIGDYLLQNDPMAAGKKQNPWICTVHCLVWTLCVWGCVWVDQAGRMALGALASPETIHLLSGDLDRRWLAPLDVAGARGGCTSCRIARS